MNSNNKEKKCKICGKILVGNNNTGICSACIKKGGDTTVTAAGIAALILGSIIAVIKIFKKKD